MSITLFPHTPLEWILQVLGSIVFSYIVLSFAEYLFHRFLMHQGLPKWVYRIAPPLETLLTDHRKLHHQVYYHEFNHEPDERGRDINLRFGWEHTFFGILFFVPLLILTTLYVSLVPAIVFIICAELHACIWNKIHVEMHQPKYPAWTNWRIYRFLGRQHYLHHKNTRTGLNIVLPLFDGLFGTTPALTEADILEIEKLGFA